MEVEIDDEHLRAVLSDASLDGTLQTGIAKAFRRRVIDILSANDERDFYAIRSWNYERLEGKRSHQYSIRLNIQWRLILEYEMRGTQKVVHIKAIEDYH